MYHNDDLFKLIKSLSHPEKVRFRQFLKSRKSADSGHLYLAIYRKMEQQKVYDESKIRKYLFHGKEEKQFPVIKNYLFHLILESLNTARSLVSLDAELDGLLQKSDILFEKGLYTSCAKLIEKAKKTAEENDSFIHQLGAINREERIAVYIYRLWESNEEELRKSHREKEEIFRKLANIQDYLLLRSVLSVKFRPEKVQRRDPDAGLMAILNDPLLVKEEMAISFPAKTLFFQCRELGARLTNDQGKHYEAAKKSLALIEKHPARFGDRVKFYLAALHNFGPACIETDRYDELPALVVKIRQLLRDAERPDTDLKERCLISSSHLELWYYASGVETDKGVLLLNRIKIPLSEVAENRYRVDKAIIYYNAFKLLIAAGRFQEALSWLNNFFNTVPPESDQDLQANARVLELIIHFELNNTDILEALVRSVYRFLFRHKRLYALETKLLEFIRNKLPKVKKPEQLTVYFKELRDDLAVLLKDPFEKVGFEYFDYVSWLESKISGRPFAEILRQKAQRVNG